MQHPGNSAAQVTCRDVKKMRRKMSKLGSQIFCTSVNSQNLDRNEEREEDKN